DVIQDLKDTLAVQKNPEGVGLAGPQIGKNLRIFIANYKGFERVVINPEVISVSQQTKVKQKKSTEILEGCLSLPHYYGPLRRNSRVKVKYLDESGKEVTEDFTGFN